MFINGDKLPDSAFRWSLSLIQMVDFPYEYVEVRVNHEDLSSLLYRTGYVACKLINKVHCEECQRLFGDVDIPFDMDIDEQLLAYFQCFDRGGLIYPSNLLFNIIQCSYSKYIRNIQ